MADSVRLPCTRVNLSDKEEHAECSVLLNDLEIKLVGCKAIFLKLDAVLPDR